MQFQLPYPPPPDMPIDPPGKVELLFACILVVALWFEVIVWLLPERWREKIDALQYGASWTAKRRERP